jgi:hypothetical protein
MVIKLGIVAHACNFSSREAEVGGSQVQGQPRLCSELEASLDCIVRLLSQKQTKMVIKMISFMLHVFYYN